MSGRKIAFGWYGGKYNHLKWLLPLLPSTHHYCEPFGGSAAVLLNRKPSPVETYNDIDHEVVNFFRVLRNQTDELIKKIRLTPFSREEFTKSIKKPNEDLSDLERASLFYVRARQVRSGLAQSATPGRWAYCVKSSRNGMSGAISRWLGGIEDLHEIAGRLSRVQIENRPALDVIDRYDTKETLFYCDPPYLPKSREDENVYIKEMDKDDHIELADALKECQAMVAISSYKSDLMNNLYGGWNCIEAPEKNCHSGKSPRKEILWTNYSPKEQ